MEIMIINNKYIQIVSYVNPNQIILNNNPIYYPILYQLLQYNGCEHDLAVQTIYSTKQYRQLFLIADIHFSNQTFVLKLPTNNFQLASLFIHPHKQITNLNRVSEFENGKNQKTIPSLKLKLLMSFELFYVNLFAQISTFYRQKAQIKIQKRKKLLTLSTHFNYINTSLLVLVEEQIENFILEIPPLSFKEFQRAKNIKSIQFLANTDKEILNQEISSTQYSSISTPLIY
eukprot:TRINITY_DN9458_c1_g3_i1.p1 TRINITY_DN9458_c1_g3~~TRINITY_DN9458_c1_g3_i1.p1  ORF type:complete len:230 (+),score=-16.75 TRINITY_DN9458_c1_g3_i1:57-746(+)